MSEPDATLHSHLCDACGERFSHVAACPEGEDVEFYCNSHIATQFTWSPDETGMSDDEGL